MPLLSQAGKYNATVKDFNVSRDEEKKTPQFVATLDISARWDKATKTMLAEPENTFITAYLPLFVADKDTGEIVPWENKIQSLMSTFGWDGKKLSELAAMKLKGVAVSITVEIGTTGKPFVKWLNPAGGSLKRTDAKEVADLDAEFDCTALPAIAQKKPEPAAKLPPKRTTKAAPAAAAPADPDAY